MASTSLIWIFVTMSLGVVILWLAKLIAPNLPQFIQDLLLYGKARGNRRTRTVVRTIEVPKSWFLHFYAFGFCMSVASVVITARSYIQGVVPPDVVRNALNYLTDSPKVATMDPLATLLILSMMLCQHTRRLYECLFVSVYSKGTMNLIHYFMGALLYGTFSLTVLCESEPLRGPVKNLVPSLESDTRGWMFKILGVFLFVVASYYHNSTHRQLAALRAGKKGANKDQHYIPRGGLFELVSSPHMLMEVLLYLSFALVSQCRAPTVLLGPVLFTVSNQIAASHITHSWYKERFRTYPQSRRALIPYLF